MSALVCGAHISFFDLSFWGEKIHIRMHVAYCHAPPLLKLVPVLHIRRFALARESAPAVSHGRKRTCPNSNSIKEQKRPFSRVRLCQGVAYDLQSECHNDERADEEWEESDQLPGVEHR